jgi:UDP-N-acetylglucosamine--N-acetylmuramyl-(pentapeptide) pyrophosphoryl-undecaprenol N-acetylglucosamine transferase
VHSARTEHRARKSKSVAVEVAADLPDVRRIRQVSTSKSGIPSDGESITCGLLVLGGSLGSRQINDSVLTAVEQCATELTDWKIIHQTGPEGADDARSLYSRLEIAHDVAPFFADLPSRLAEATLAVARAGATTLAELAAVGVPAVLVPYPTAADDHQTRNAQLFVETGAAAMVTSADGSFAPVDLVPTLKPLLADQPHLLNMSQAMKTLARPEAAKEVVAILHSLVN